MSKFNFIRANRYHAAAMLVTTAGAILPKTLFIDNVKNLLQRYSEGFPVPLTPKLRSLFNEVLDDLHTPDDVRESLKPMFTPAYFGYYGFVNYKTELDEYLKPDFKLKCLIWIPEYFEFQDTYDVPNHFEGPGVIENVELISTDGEDPRGAFVLSDKAQKYALARVICEAENPINYFLPALPAIAIRLNLAMIKHVVFNYPKLFEYSKWSKRGILGAAGFLSVYIYKLAKDFLSFQIEYEADQKVSLLGKDYIEGGVEFCQKTLWQNRLARSKMRIYVKWTISDQGDYTQYFRRKHVPILHRKRDLEALLEQYKIAQ